jgi:uracil-DNA glycosylase family 4
MHADHTDRPAELGAYHHDEIMSCTRCPLHATRTQAVPGSGNPNAQVMFVGEAPGYHEDRQGVPFVGQAGKLLDQLLEGIGLAREDVFIANVLKCRPPENRDPLPAEIAACQDHLFRQVQIIRPRLICTLGNFATKLLSGRPDGISRVHGCELEISLGGTPTMLYPLYHPAAALYMPTMRSVLQDDFARIPALIGGDGPTGAATAAPRAPERAGVDSDRQVTEGRPPSDTGPATQLDLF